ncbi:unnamed protein product [Prorocentrum cordatum]|uniref:Uncharacterized protein n=1 Tax=Prorocentrum cordatum TaxID=2364126 RepID=A0ABN9T3E1_9DINO|nr:unnamed protein product [Polarella glacialis]
MRTGNTDTTTTIARISGEPPSRDDVVSLCCGVPLETPKISSSWRHHSPLIRRGGSAGVSAILRALLAQVGLTRGEGCQRGRDCALGQVPRNGKTTEEATCAK